MIVRDGSLLDLLGKLGGVRVEWRDVVVPEKVELIGNNRYASGYAWMFSYERVLKRRIEEALTRRLDRDEERRLFGENGVVSEALSNAFVHGHRRSLEMPIIVTCSLGSTGVVISVRDHGDGFDVADVLSGLKGGGRYYRVAGNGLRAIDGAGEIAAMYDEGGRRIAMFIPFRLPAGDGVNAAASRKDARDV